MSPSLDPVARSVRSLCVWCGALMLAGLATACDDGAMPPVVDGAIPTPDAGADAIPDAISDVMPDGMPDAFDRSDAMADAMPDATDGMPDAGCVPGKPGCDCDPDGACVDGFRCEADVCVGCVPGLPDCPCAAGNCGDELACVDDLCVECTSAIEGCSCDADGVCEGGLVCGEQACRAPIECAEAGCAPNQRCAEAGDDQEDPGEDARCLEACLPGFVYDPETGTCPEEIGVNCDPGALGSILAACEADNRRCVPRGDGAECGVCLDGFTDEQGGRDACRPYATCAGLMCATASRRCVEGGPAEDARCTTCVEGFVERGGACVPDVPDPTCEPGAPGSRFDDCDAQGRLCEVVGFEARCGGCQPGFEERDGACLPPLPVCDPDACAALGRRCGDDGACGGCQPGLEPAGDECLPPCDPLACAAEGRTCEGAEPGTCGPCADGFAEVGGACEPSPCDEALCAAAGRTCVGAPLGGCGACLAGEAEDPADSSSACTVFRTCRPDDVDGRRCRPEQALRCDQLGDNLLPTACVDCAIECAAGSGQTGARAPVTQVDSGRCFCEVEDGYYFDDSAQARSAQPCDADGDGWTRLAARRALGPDADPQLRRFARCDLRRIDRVLLQNEYGQQRTLAVCDGDLLQPERCVGPPRVLDLYEPGELDDQDLLERRGATLYVHDGAGRAPRADELNPLTKGCVLGADYNANGEDDVREHHAAGAPDGLDPGLAPFLALTYFTELHRGRYAPGEGDAPGAWLIAERSRCDADFPLVYEAGASEQWRACDRNRDANYDLAAPLNGFDFARWSCEAGEAGSCAVLPAVLGPLEADESLCDPAVRARFVEGDADGAYAVGWRGMNHHSQFKCVEIGSDGAAHQLPLDALFDAEGRSAWRFDRCRVACPADDPDCAADCGAADADCVAACAGDVDCLAACPLRCAGSTETPATRDPRHARVECVADDPEPGDVGFVAAQYVDRAGVYSRGCVDEWAPGPDGAVNVDGYKLRCPGYADNPDGVRGGGNPAAFGRLLCGCGLHYGGVDCAVGCPDVPGALFGGPAVDDADCPNGYCPLSSAPGESRRGYWSCGGVGGATVEGGDPDAAPGDLSADGWTVRGSTGALTTEALCEGGPCPPAGEPGVGWRVY